MDQETRTALDLLSSEMSAGFARMDRYFELSQAQFLDFRDEVNRKFDELTKRVDELTRRVDELTVRVNELTVRVDALTVRVEQLESEVRSLRNWTAREFAEIRTDRKSVRRHSDARIEKIETELASLETRVARIEGEAGQN